MAPMFCTYCVDSPIRASKRCVQCKTPFCDKHLTAHNKRFNHDLIDLTTSSDDCHPPSYKELLEYYCNTDRDGMYSTGFVNRKRKKTSMDNQNDLTDGREESLSNVKERLKEKEQQKENEISSMKSHEKAQVEKAEAARQRVIDQTEGIIQQLQTIQTQVNGEIKRMKDAVLDSVTEKTKNLEAQKNELLKKIRLMEEPCRELTFTFQNGIKKAHLTGIPNGGNIKIEIAEFEETRISEMLYKELSQLADGVIKRMLKDDFPKMKKSAITLDLKTAHNQIKIPNLSSASYTARSQNRTKGPKRFRSRHVLSECSFSSGNHYWEVEVKGTQCIIGVAYTNIRRNTIRLDSRIGYNVRSWGLSVDGGLCAWHNYVKTKIPTDSPVRSFGIFLEYEAGRLSFYQLCDPIRHLHTFTTTFTKPLHAAFFVGKGSGFQILK